MFDDPLFLGGVSDELMLNIGTMAASGQDARVEEVVIYNNKLYSNLSITSSGVGTSYYKTNPNYIQIANNINNAKFIGSIQDSGINKPNTYLFIITSDKNLYVCYNTQVPFKINNQLINNKVKCAQIMSSSSLIILTDDGNMYNHNSLVINNTLTLIKSNVKNIFPPFGERSNITDMYFTTSNNELYLLSSGLLISSKIADDVKYAAGSLYYSSSIIYGYYVDINNKLYISTTKTSFKKYNDDTFQCVKLCFFNAWATKVHMIAIKENSIVNNVLVFNNKNTTVSDTITIPKKLRKISYCYNVAHGKHSFLPDYAIIDEDNVAYFFNTSSTTLLGTINNVKNVFIFDREDTDGTCLLEGTDGHFRQYHNQVLCV